MRKPVGRTILLDDCLVSSNICHGPEQSTPFIDLLRHGAYPRPAKLSGCLVGLIVLVGLPHSPSRRLPKAKGSVEDKELVKLKHGVPLLYKPTLRSCLIPVGLASASFAFLDTQLSNEGDH